MQIYTISFFGHRHVEDYRSLENSLERLVQRLIQQKEYVEFMVGRNGEFDQIVSSAVRRVKRAFERGNVCHVCVLPYATAEYLNNQASFESYYDEICIPAQVHPKAAMQARNRWMVDHSDRCVFYVNRKSGGAWQTLQYALKQKKSMTNYGKISV